MKICQLVNLDEKSTQQKVEVILKNNTEDTAFWNFHFQGIPVLIMYVCEWGKGHFWSSWMQNAPNTLMIGIFNFILPVYKCKGRYWWLQTHDLAGQLKKGHFPIYAHTKGALKFLESRNFRRLYLQCCSSESLQIFAVWISQPTVPADKFSFLSGMQL